MGLAGTRLGFRAGLTYIPAMLRMPPAAHECQHHSRHRCGICEAGPDARGCVPACGAPRRLECDEDKGRFEATIGKIAKAKPK
jgi:hypothetical protein